MLNRETFNYTEPLEVSSLNVLGTLNATMQQQRNPAVLWTLGNPVLAAGQIGIETDTRFFKFGDGITPWNSLAYASATGSTTGGTTTATVDSTTTGFLLGGM
jgi:hypothetical protein